MFNAQTYATTSAVSPSLLADPEALAVLTNHLMKTALAGIATAAEGRAFVVSRVRLIVGEDGIADARNVRIAVLHVTFEMAKMHPLNRPDTNQAM